MGESKIYQLSPLPLTSEELSTILSSPDTGDLVYVLKKDLYPCLSREKAGGKKVFSNSRYWCDGPVVKVGKQPAYMQISGVHFSTLPHISVQYFVIYRLSVPYLLYQRPCACLM